jgi:hypothetical protein
MAANQCLFFVFWRQNKIQCDWLIIQRIFFVETNSPKSENSEIPYNMAAYQCFFFFGDKKKSNVADSSYKGIFWGNKCAKIWQFWNYLYLDNRFLSKSPKYNRILRFTSPPNKAKTSKSWIQCDSPCVPVEREGPKITAHFEKHIYICFNFSCR